MRDKSLPARFAATASQQETKQQELQQHAVSYFQNCRYGQGRNQIPGLLCKNQNKQQDTACAARKKYLHILNMEGAFCKVRWQSLTLDSSLTPAALLKAIPLKDRNKISQSPSVFFLGVHKNVHFATSPV